MKKKTTVTALFLTMFILLPIFTGCGLFGGGGEDKKFDPPYLQNYYVNKHTPVALAGSLDVYQYTSEKSETFTMGGYDYHGGVILHSFVAPVEYARAEFPLDKAYDYFSFVLGGMATLKEVMETQNGKDIYYTHMYAIEGAYPTQVGYASDQKVGLQILIDGVVKEEILLSGYDVSKRYTYDVKGADKIEVKAVTGECIDIPLMEITVWEGEPHETGHITEPAGSGAVKLIRDIKPYNIPTTSAVEYYPNYASDERDYINMGGVTYKDAIAARVAIALIGEDEECVFFDLEGKYNYLTFEAGAADRTTNFDEGSAWITVSCDGRPVLEELVSTHDLPKRFTVNIAGCHQLKFTFTIGEGNDVIGDSTGGIYGIGNAYVAVSEEALNGTENITAEYPDRNVKVVSELGVFGVYSSVEKAVFDGSNGFETFSMGGIKYNEGIILLSSNNLIYSDKPSYASFNLGGKYNTISFIAGHISNSDIYKDEEIEVYGDGTLLKTINVQCTMIPQKYIIDTNGIKQIEFVSGKVHGGSMFRPALGVAELTAYPGGYEESGLFPQRKAADLPQTADLIDTVGFYDVHNPHSDIEIGAVGVEDGYYDGTTAKNSFKVGDRLISKGLLMHTSVHLSFDTDEADSLFALNLIGFSPLALAAADEVHESAFALANLKDTGYTSVTFTTAYYDDGVNASTYQKQTQLFIGADDRKVGEFTLYKDMEPQTFTVTTGECERLIFWLNCSEDDDSSYTYAIYDITLDKDVNSSEY